MAQKVYIKYKENGILTNAYSVRLGSEDGTYGIKLADTGQVIVSHGTDVDNPSTGVYEYVFSPPVDDVYVISWEVVPDIYDEPRYVVQRVGPFGAYSNVIAVARERGRFTQGSLGSLLLNITEFNGTPIDPESINFTITDRNATEIYATGIPDKVKKGTFVFDWGIPKDHPAGEYIVTWLYTINGITSSENHSLIVSSSTGTSNLYNVKTILIRDSIELMIDAAQNIPVYYHQAQPSWNNKEYQWTRGNWNQKSGTRVYRNKKIVTEGYEIDFDRGKVIFDQPLTDYDIVHADYNFRWFSDDQLDRFISNGIHKVNSYPPHTNYNTVTLPEKYIPAMLYSAAADALRNLMMSLNFQEPAQYFGGFEEASKRFGQLETLKQNYEKDAQQILENKKFFPYKGLTRAVVTPEYTLPGGRSRWFRYLFSGSGG